MKKRSSFLAFGAVGALGLIVLFQNCGPSFEANSTAGPTTASLNSGGFFSSSLLKVENPKDHSMFDTCQYDVNSCVTGSWWADQLATSVNTQTAQLMSSAGSGRSKTLKSASNTTDVKVYYSQGKIVQLVIPLNFQEVPRNQDFNASLAIKNIIGGRPSSSSSSGREDWMNPTIWCDQVEQYCELVFDPIDNTLNVNLSGGRVASIICFGQRNAHDEIETCTKTLTVNQSPVFVDADAI